MPSSVLLAIASSQSWTIAARSALLGGRLIPRRLDKKAHLPRSRACDHRHGVVRPFSAATVAGHSTSPGNAKELGRSNACDPEAPAASVRALTLIDGTRASRRPN